MQLRPAPILGARRHYWRAMHGTRCFVLRSRGADVVEDAVRAVWFTGLAGAASVQDQEVREDGPVSLWHDLHEVLLYLHRVFVIRQAEPSRDAADVGIDDYALVHTEGVAQNDVGRLAADAGQRHELLHGAGHLSPVLIHED